MAEGLDAFIATLREIYDQELEALEPDSVKVAPAHEWRLPVSGKAGDSDSISDAAREKDEESTASPRWRTCWNPTNCAEGTQSTPTPTTDDVSLFRRTTERESCAVVKRPPPNELAAKADVSDEVDRVEGTHKPCAKVSPSVPKVHVLPAEEPTPPPAEEPALREVVATDDPGSRASARSQDCASPLRDRSLQLASRAVPLVTYSKKGRKRKAREEAGGDSAVRKEGRSCISNVN